MHGLAFAKRPEDPIHHDQLVRVIVARVVIVQRVMQAVMLDRREEVGIPARRIEADVGMGEIGHGTADIACTQQCFPGNVEEDDQAHAEEQDLDPVSDRGIHRVQLRDVVMRDMHLPQDGIIVHAGNEDDADAGESDTEVTGALAGVAWGLHLTDTTLSVPAMMGAIMCLGVATANSVLVATFARQNLAEGRDGAR